MFVVVWWLYLIVVNELEKKLVDNVRGRVVISSILDDSDVELSDVF